MRVFTTIFVRHSSSITYSRDKRANTQKQHRGAYREVRGREDGKPEEVRKERGREEGKWATSRERERESVSEPAR